MPSKPEVLKERRENDVEYAARIKEYSRSYRERNLEKERERQRESKKASRANNREANNAYMREWNAKNRDRINAKRRERLLNDQEYAERVRENDRARHLADPNRSRRQNLKSMYGITLDEYQKMYIEQDGKCAICGTLRENKGRDGLVVDHCHKGNHIRGLLCSSCNQGLGRFKDNPEYLLSAYKYILENK